MLKPQTVIQKTNDAEKIWYSVTDQNGIEVAVPQDDLNSDYQAILTWVNNGGVIELG